MRRARWWIVAAVLAAAIVLLGLLPAIGLERLPIAATVLPARNAWTFGAAAAGLLLAAAGAWRWRRIVLPLGLALLVGAAASLPVVLQRGLADAAPVGTGSGGGLRILSWNVNGSLVGPAAIARIAAAQQADVVVLPESATSIYGDRLVPALARAGLDMVELPAGMPGTTVTLVLARRSLGPWRLLPDRSPEPDRSAVLTSTRPGVPRIVALHAVIPTPRSTDRWSADLDWVAAECRDADTVVVGDFNTSLDGFGSGLGRLDGLGGCSDAAMQAGAASVGSWPTAVPTWLAMPIDHVLTGAGWRARSFTVLTAEDGSGARHRPVLAVVSAR